MATPVGWPRLQREEHPDWELYRTAELAMAVMGRRAPEKLDDKPWHRKEKYTFDQEAIIFIGWLRNEFENCWLGIRGPKPDFLKTYKTAVSLAVARYVVCKRGGRHYNKPPTPREIAQIWFVLFGEHEPHGSIKSRLPGVARFCKQFAKDQHPLVRKQAEYFRKAGDCLLRKLPPKKPKEEPEVVPLSLFSRVHARFSG